MTSNTVTRPLRAGVLNRKSTVQDDRRSVGQQNAENLAVCEVNGWTVGNTYEMEHSASRFGGNNPIETVLAEPLADIRSGKIDVLVVWEASRASRDMAAFGLLLNACEEHGVLICVGGRIYDASESTDRMTLGIDALAAEREATDTRKRIMRDQRHAAEKGRPHGRKLYGYRRVYDDSTPPKLIGQVPDEHEAKVVREIVDDFLQTGRTGWIARKLNDRGELSPAGKQWHLAQVKRILTMPSYAGLRQYRGEVIGEADWPAIVTLDERDRIQSLLDGDPLRTKSRTKKDLKYLLSGIARCGVPECGDFMYRSHDRNDRDIYWCRGSKNPNYRKGHLVRDMNLVDALVTTTLLERLAQPDALDALSPEPDPAAAEARLKVSELQSRLDDAVDKFTEGNLTGATLARIEASLLPQIEAARREARAASALPTSVFDFASAEDVDLAWENADIPTRRTVIGALMDIKVMPSSLARGSRKFNPEDITIIWRV